MLFYGVNPAIFSKSNTVMHSTPVLQVDNFNAYNSITILFLFSY